MADFVKFDRRKFLSDPEVRESYLKLSGKFNRIRNRIRKNLVRKKFKDIK